MITSTLTRGSINRHYLHEVFFNNLGGVECSQADYSNAQHVWDNFNCSSLKEYMALYL